MFGLGGIMQYTEQLFSYGTLRYESVQLSTFGRLLKGRPDKLIGYHLSSITITDPKVIKTSGESIHSILIYTGNPQDEVNGTVFDISKEELLQADKYEVSDYKRVQAKLKSGSQAWVYISAA